ncbi:hypothetical protein FN846DRAFT_334256 [Sphaerosporella brunnea]|uniref:Coronin n=1 Tax=Sphaerosporella brunnea TaxID=1250544 RepID=A0A5J5EKC8_9PEZI|nr:hypothetical protein FN846DRAFT_334256 [Sphaerosporella brunnea]
MAGRFVRSSKYRHVFGRPTKKELCYDNLHISKNAWDSNIIKANPQYLSVNWEAGGGGAFAVIPLAERGRFPELIPLFRGHTAAVLDTDWHPSNDSMIASGSDDGKVFIWSVPENFSLHYDEEEGPKDVSPVSKLAGHTRKVGHVLFHPTAENVLATSSGDYTIKLWDIATGASNHTLKHGDIVQSLSWSTNGSMLVTTCRDKKLRIWDPRQEKAAHEVAGHAGAKNSRAVWMTGDVGGDKIATTGFSKMSDRQLGHWDLRTLSEGPVGGFEMLDSISGVCMPFWDEGTKCLYLAGKGDGNIRYYEYENGEFIYLSEYKSGDPQRGVAFLPRRGLTVHENEVMRAFKTVNDTYIEPISFVVPRRAETYQSDIYPPATSGKAALSAEAWFGGEDADPPMIDMETLYSADAAAAAAAASKPFVPAISSAQHTPRQSVSERAPTSPIKETPKAFPATVTPSPVAEPSREIVRPKSPVRTSTFTPPPLKAVTPPAAATPVPNATPVPTFNEKALTDRLEKITELLEKQNLTLVAQNDQIRELTKEVDTLREKINESATTVVVGNEELEEESRRKDEIIRKLELELEEARS